MRIQYVTYLFPILLCYISTIQVFGQFSMDGEIRPRFEYRNGFKQLRDSSTTAALLVTQRSRFNLNYSHENMIVKLSFQDVRVWGDEKIKTDVPSTALHEGWVELRLIDSLSLKIGRQEIYYDNQRIMSNSNWLQQAASHDAILAKYHKNSWAIDVGLAFNQLSDATVFGTDYTQGQGNYKSLDYLWITKYVNPFSISGVFISDGFQKTPDTVNYRYTGGGILLFNKNNLTFALRSFYQGGKTINGQTINAYYVNTDLSYPFKILQSAIGFELFSGNNNSNKTDSKFRAFNYLYGTGQKFNGHLGYFLRTESTKNEGLLDIYMTLGHKFNKSASLNVDYHYFRIPNPYLNPLNNKLINQYLGSEIDMSAKIEFSKEVGLLFGYCIMKAEKSMEILQGRGDSLKLAHWVFIMLTVKPIFFKS